MMNPKTFQVKLHNPLGPMMKIFVGRGSYTFEIHAADYQEAFNWVMRMFNGIDMETSVGSIVDCDSIKKHQNVNGKRITIEKPEGYYRASPEEVAISLYKLIEALNDDYVKALDQVDRNAILYENFETDSHLNDLNEAKECARRAKAWLDNLLKDFPSQCNKDPMREEVRQVLLDAVDKIDV
jgi:hypothetical protein